MKYFLLLFLCASAIRSTAQNFSLYYNGIDQYVSIPDQNSVDLSGDFTIEGWTLPVGFRYTGYIKTPTFENGVNTKEFEIISNLFHNCLDIEPVKDRSCQSSDTY